MIELADGGTLFLDEIGELPLEFQWVLLRILEENTLVRVSDQQPVRVIAATNRELRQAIEQGALLGMHPEKLRSRMQKYGLRRP